MVGLSHWLEEQVEWNDFYLKQNRFIQSSLMVLSHLFISPSGNFALEEQSVPTVGTCAAHFAPVGVRGVTCQTHLTLAMPKYLCAPSVRHSTRHNTESLADFAGRKMQDTKFPHK